MDESTNNPPAGVKGRSLYLTLSAPPEHGISLRDLGQEFWSQKWLLIGLSLLFGVLAAGYSLTITAIYRSEVVLAPAATGSGMSNASALGGLAGLAGINLTAGSDQTELIAMLESRGFIEAFIKDRGLMPILFADRWDAEAQSWKVENVEDQPDLRDGVDYFTRHVRFVSEDQPRTGLVTLAIEWRDPEQAALWAADLVSRINERARLRDINESQRKLDYLSEQLRQANVIELRQAISRVIEDQMSSMMLAQAQEEYAFKVIDPPVVPKRRIWPKRTLIVLVASFLGGFIAALLVLARFAMRNAAPSAGA